MIWARLKDIPAYILLALALLVLLSRFLPIPLGAFMVASGSMLPSIRPFDIGIVLGRSFNAGDVIVWSSSLLYYVMHRAVDINNSMVVTMGDANPIPDPPVPISQVKGKVIAIIPREAWLLTIASLLGAHIYTKRRALARLNLSGMKILMPLLIYCLFVISITFLIAPSYSLGYMLSRPEIHLSRTDIVDPGGSCAIKITYYLKNIELLRVLEVKVNDIPVNFSYDSKSILAPVPHEAALHTASTGERFKVTVKAELTRMGRLSGSYEVPVSLKKPLLKVSGGGILIENPNPLPLKFNVTFIYSNGGPWQSNSTIIILSKGPWEIQAPWARYVYVDVKYKWLGAEFYERLKVR